MGDSLFGWVSSSLHDIIDYSDDTLADYLIATAKKSRSAASLVLTLQEHSLPINDKTRRFAQQLFERVPRFVASVPAKKHVRKRAEREAIAANRRNLEYQLVDDADDDTSLEAMIELAESEARRKLEKKKKKKLRKRSVAAIDETYVETLISPRKKKKIKKETKEEREERERLEDLKERDELVERMIERDEARARARANMLSDEQKDVKLEEDRRQGIIDMSQKEQEKYLAQTREVSRQKYLTEREQMQLLLKQREVDEHERFFAGENLSKEEIQQHQDDLEALAMAKERAQDVEDVDAYSIPKPMWDPSKGDSEKIDFDAERKRALNQRYKADDVIVDEQRDWEDKQLHKAVGSETQSKSKHDKDYEYIFDSQIDFIRDRITKGERPEEEIEEIEVSAEDIKKDKYETLQEVRKSLPIFLYREQLLEAVDKHQILILVGETGSGKTTQIPQYLHEHGYTKDGKKIAVTQPRRVAAMSVAARVADEMAVKLGHEVGYSIRFENCTSEKTVIKYMTDGMLLREFLTEPDLASYSVIILDEAHERTLHTDVLFGLVKDVARFRPDLKLIISSATLDADKFSDFFDDAPKFSIPGRRYPIEIFYTKAPEADYLDACIVTVLQIHISQPPGDILVFLTGQEEIETCCEILQQRTRSLASRYGELIIAPIYSTLPSDQQAKIFDPTPHGARKVVVATNIAETSLTIDGIIYVIDPGFCKQNSYNPRTGMESLIVTPVAKSSANQRSGRAGRVASGKCFRLFTKHAYEHELEENTIPEIQRTNLGNVVLMLKSLGINDLIHFDFMDPPPAETLIRALEQLYALGALNDHGELTKLGRRMAEFPMDPMMSKTLIQAGTYKCSEQMVTICSMLSVNNAVFYTPKEKKIHAVNAHKNFNRPGGDHMTLLNVYDQWVETEYSTEWCYENYLQAKSMKRARDIRDQLVGLLERVEVDLTSDDDQTVLAKTITSGFFYHTARLDKSGNYKTTKHHQTVFLHPSSTLHQEVPRWVIYHELVLTSKEYMRCIIEIKPEWLVEIAPHFYKQRDIVDNVGKKMPKIRKMRQQEAVD
uniref:RNA helicase n=3 Tax=Hirondellea gigas TaxID=1518452 RepID=A0A6A7G1D3_9CRUS